MDKYELPEILSEKTTYADMCVFLQVQKFLPTMFLYIPEWLYFEEMNLFDNKSRTLPHFAAAGLYFAKDSSGYSFSWLIMLMEKKKS